MHAAHTARTQQGGGRRRQHHATYRFPTFITVTNPLSLLVIEVDEDPAWLFSSFLFLDIGWAATAVRLASGLKLTKEVDLKNRYAIKRVSFASMS